jgi:hypothetical protein
VSGFEGIDQVIVPMTVTTETQRFLRSMGERGHEGLALWIGRPEGREFHVTNLLIPRQRARRTPDGVCASVDADEMYRINVELFKAELRLIAQVHSHPTDAYHSDTDDEHALVNTVGGLSLVVPDFAMRPFSLDDTAVFRLDRSGTWQELDQRAVTALLRIAG